MAWVRLKMQKPHCDLKKKSVKWLEWQVNTVSVEIHHLSSRSCWTCPPHNTRCLADVIVMSVILFECCQLVSLRTRRVTHKFPENKVPLPVTFSSSSVWIDILKGKPEFWNEVQSLEVPVASKDIVHGTNILFSYSYQNGFIFSHYFYNKNAALQCVLIKCPRTPCWMKGRKCTPMLHLVTLYYVD